MFNSLQDVLDNVKRVVPRTASAPPSTAPGIAAKPEPSFIPSKTVRQGSRLGENADNLPRQTHLAPPHAVAAVAQQAVPQQAVAQQAAAAAVAAVNAVEASRKEEAAPLAQAQPAAAHAPKERSSAMPTPHVNEQRSQGGQHSGSYTGQSRVQPGRGSNEHHNRGQHYNGPRPGSFTNQHGFPAGYPAQQPMSMPGYATSPVAGGYVVPPQMYYPGPGAAPFYPGGQYQQPMQVQYGFSPQQGGPVPQAMHHGPAQVAASGQPAVPPPAGAPAAGAAASAAKPTIQAPAKKPLLIKDPKTKNVVDINSAQQQPAAAAAPAPAAEGKSTKYRGTRQPRQCCIGACPSVVSGHERNAAMHCKSLSCATPRRITKQHNAF